MENNNNNDVGRAIGLTATDMAYIVSVLREFTEIKKAVVFGSRAKGSHKPGSDVDIAIYGEDISFSTVARLHYRLEEEGPLPYFFDIVDYSHLASQPLKEHSDRVGKTIFERTTDKPSYQASPEKILNEEGLLWSGCAKG